MKSFFTVLAFELKRLLKRKSYWLFTIIFALILAIVLFIPNITSFFGVGEPDRTGLPVILVSSPDSTLAESSLPLLKQAFPEYDVQTSDLSVEQMEEEIDAKKIECAFVITSPNSADYYTYTTSFYDDKASQVENLLQQAYEIDLLKKAGVSQQEIDEIENAEVSVNTVTIGPDQSNNFIYTYVMILALYLVIILYGQIVASNVAAEKSNKSMEVLVTSVKPTALLFGKIISACLAGLLQIFLIFGSAVLFYQLNKAAWNGNLLIEATFNIPLSLLGYMLLFFLLGFFLYAALYGAAASFVSKMEEVSSVTMPITFLFVAAFLITNFAMTGGDVNSWPMVVCSYIPFTSPMAMFTRICLSQVPAWEIWVSVAILVATTILICYLAAKIYRAGVLMYGTKPSPKAIYQALFHS